MFSINRLPNVSSIDHSFSTDSVIDFHHTPAGGAHFEDGVDAPPSGDDLEVYARGKGGKAPEPKKPEPQPAPNPGGGGTITCPDGTKPIVEPGDDPQTIVVICTVPTPFTPIRLPD